MSQSKIYNENQHLTNDNDEDGVDTVSLEWYVSSPDRRLEIQEYGRRVKRELGSNLKAIHIMPNVGFTEYRQKRYLNGVVYELHPATRAKTIAPYLLPLYQYRKVMVTQNPFEKKPAFEKDWKALAESMDIHDSSTEAVQIKKIIADILRNQNTEKGSTPITKDNIFHDISDVYCDRIVERMAEKEKLIDKFDLGLENISIAGVYSHIKGCVPDSTVVAVSGGNRLVEKNLHYLMNIDNLTVEDFAHNVTTNNKFINIIRKLKDLQILNNEKLMSEIIKLLEKHGIPAMKSLIDTDQVEIQTAFFNTIHMKNSTCYITQGCYDFHSLHTHGKVIDETKQTTSNSAPLINYFFLNNDACYKLNVQTPLFSDNDYIPIDTGSQMDNGVFSDIENTVLTNMRNINVVWAGKSNISFFHFKKQNPFSWFMNQLALMRKGSLYNQYSTYLNISCICGEIDLENVTFENLLWATFTKPDDFVIKIRFNDNIFKSLQLLMSLQDDLKQNVCFGLFDNMLYIRLAFLRLADHPQTLLYSDANEPTFSLLTN